MRSRSGHGAGPGQHVETADDERVTESRASGSRSSARLCRWIWSTRSRSSGASRSTCSRPRTTLRPGGARLVSATRQRSHHLTTRRRSSPPCWTLRAGLRRVFEAAAEGRCARWSRPGGDQPDPAGRLSRPRTRSGRGRSRHLPPHRRRSGRAAVPDRPGGGHPTHRARSLPAPPVRQRALCPALLRHDQERHPALVQPRLHESGAVAASLPRTDA